MKRLRRALWLATAIQASAAVQAATELKFDHRERGVVHPVGVLLADDRIRLERPHQRYTILYDAPTETYTGLELRDGKYWRFRWPEVEAAVSETTRNKQLLQSMDLGGILEAETEPAAGPSTEGLPVPAYQWHSTGRTGTRLGKSVTEWIGRSDTGQLITAWATREEPEGLSTLLKQLAPVNRQIQLAVVRSPLPQELFTAAEGLSAEGWVPLDVSIGGGPVEGRERVVLKSISAVNASPKAFSVPEGFRETDAVAMRGIFAEVPEEKEHEEQNIFNRGERAPLIPNPR
ncbi:MAG: hypothetical protein AAGK14_03330 [Verrucomicrobiota bacterium]